ncbi:MAG TPA: hypothetical protein VMV86_06005 [Methanosarcinales archaeon]|nr:hypothetical protein [Methanosarcinales archaeon]
MEKKAQQRKIRNVISPLNFVSRKYLSYRSPIYKEAQVIVEQADTLFRDTVQTQKGYLKNLKKDKKDLAAVRLAQRTAAFLREQVLLSQTSDLIGEKFAQIEGVGVPASQLKDINYYISADIGKTPEYNPNQVVEDKIDMEDEWSKERPSIWRRFVTEYFGRDYGVDERSKRLQQTPIKTSEDEFYSELVKDAFLASWFWGRTQSGKEYKKAFDTICVGAENMVNANLSLLKRLDDLRTKGDPQTYWSACQNITSGFKAILKKYGEDKRFLEAWKKFESYLPPKEEAAAAPAASPAAPVSEMPAGEPSAAPVGATPVGATQPGEPNPQSLDAPPATISDDDDNNEDEDYYSDGADIDDARGEQKIAPANKSFIHNLIKQADSGKSKEEIAMSILRYADFIDKKNPKLALQLMAIVEGVINE